MSAATISQLSFRDFIAPSIALMALLFTVGTFWWTNWRRGLLKVDRPRTFAFGQQAERSLLLIPIAISNTGARTILVSSLRIRFTLSTGQIRSALHIRNRTGPAPKSEGVEFASNFVIGGRDVEIMYCEFEFRPALEESLDGPTWVTIEALQGHKRNWVSIGQVRLHFDAQAIASNNNHYVTYDNARSLPV